MTIEDCKKVCENLDWDVIYSDHSFDVSKYSPAGEDFNFGIHAESAEQFVEEVKSYASYFDQEEHVKLWINGIDSGVSGVPSIRELVEDAQAIDEMLRELACALQKALDNDGKEPEPPKKVYRVHAYWQMSGDVNIEASSVEEAVEIALGPETPLPKDGVYLDGSFEIDKERLYADYPDDEKTDRIVAGRFISIWDGGNQQIESGCKVNLDTHEVFDIETVDVSGLDIDVITDEEVEIDGKRFRVFSAELDGEDLTGNEYWYKE